MRSLLDPGFPDDDGSVDPAVAEALAAYDTDPDTRHAVTLALLQDTRVLVPVVAVLGEAEEVTHETRDGRTVRVSTDKSADMAAVMMRGRDGRQALLAFTGLASLQAWDPGARPVPIAFPRAAEAALQEGAAALVLDLAGPVRLVVEQADLERLAAGERLVDLGKARLAWWRPGAGE